MFFLILAYPLLAYWAETAGNAALVWAALMVPVGIVLLPSLGRRSVWAWVTVVAIGALGLCLAGTDAAAYLLFLPPVLIPLLLLVLFSRGLVGSGPPMVTRIAAAMEDGDLAPEVAAYTRRVTWLWVGLFAAMVLANLLLAALAPSGQWSLFSDCLNYIVVGLLFLGEYLFRRRRFPRREHPSFHAYIRRVARIDYHYLLE